MKILVGSIDHHTGVTFFAAPEGEEEALFREMAAHAEALGFEREPGEADKKFLDAHEDYGGDTYISYGHAVLAQPGPQPRARGGRPRLSKLLFVPDRRGAARPGAPA